jgi:hypothetical protein
VLSAQPSIINAQNTGGKARRVSTSLSSLPFTPSTPIESLEQFTVHRSRLARGSNSIRLSFEVVILGVGGVLREPLFAPISFWLICASFLRSRRGSLQFRCTQASGSNSEAFSEASASICARRWVTWEATVEAPPLVTAVGAPATAITSRRRRLPSRRRLRPTATCSRPPRRTRPSTLTPIRRSTTRSTGTTTRRHHHPCRCPFRRRTTTTTGHPPPPQASSRPHPPSTPTTTPAGPGGIPPTDRICLCRRLTLSTRRPSLSATTSTLRRRRFGSSLMKNALAASSSPSPLTPRSLAGDYSHIQYFSPLNIKHMLYSNFYFMFTCESPLVSNSIGHV